MPQRSVVLLSTGLDSTVNFYMALQDGGVEAAITVDYGQIAAPKEIYLAKELASRCGVKHIVIDLPWMRGLSPLSNGRVLGEFYPSWLGDDVRSETASDKVWVPNRNGVLTNIGASVAETLQTRRVVFGANWDEGRRFSDNRQEFAAATNWVWLLSTRNHTELHSYTFSWGKKRIFQKALELGIDLNLVWPCYHAGVKLCGRCLSCVQFWNAGKDFEQERLRTLFTHIPTG